MPLYMAAGTHLNGLAKWRAGDRTGGLAEMQRGWALLHENDCYLCEPFWGMQVAVANAEAGQLDTGLEILGELIGWAEQTGQHWLDAELHRVRGELLLRRDPPNVSAAEDAFNRALEIARSQQTKTFELRGALGLARLYIKMAERRPYPRCSRQSSSISIRGEISPKSKKRKPCSSMDKWPGAATGDRSCQRVPIRAMSSWQSFRLAENTGKSAFSRALPLSTPCGMIAPKISKPQPMRRVNREASVKRTTTGIVAAVLAMSATAALAQSKPPLKLGGILDMSGLYADITGVGSETAAKMAVEDFGGEVLGRKVEIVAADHLNKADLAASIARDMLDNQGVEMLYDVAASATALAAGEIAKARNKIVMYSGPASIRLSNEACGPYTVHYAYDTFGQANVTGLATVKSGFETWFFLTADYAFGQDLEKDTTNVVVKSGGKVLGGVKHPLNTSDFSSFLLQAQASKAKVIGLANAGGDTSTPSSRRPNSD